MADVFARYAQDHLFDEIEEVGIRDGANISIDGYEFAPNFSIWTTIEECLNPPVIYEDKKGWFTTEPFSEPETFDFPEIGKVEVVNVEHEEVLLVPRWVKAKRVTFKYGLGNQFIGVLKTLHMLGLDKKSKIKVKGMEVSPRDVVAASLPTRLIWATGCTARPVRERGSRVLRMAGRVRFISTRSRIMPNVCSLGLPGRGGADCLQRRDRLGLDRAWPMEGVGVLGPEAFDPIPFMDKMADYEFPYGNQRDDQGSRVVE